MFYLQVTIDQSEEEIKHAKPFSAIAWNHSPRDHSRRKETNPTVMAALTDSLVNNTDTGGKSLL